MGSVSYTHLDVYKRQAQNDNTDGCLFNSLIIGTIKQMGLHISTDLPIEVSENSGKLILQTQKRIDRLRARLFWSCLSLDKIFGVVSGSGCMMDSKKVKSRFDPSSMHEDSKCISGLLHQYTIKLWNMVDDSVAQIYCYEFNDYEEHYKRHLLRKVINSFKVFHRSIPERLSNFKNKEHRSGIIFFHLSLCVFLMLVEKPFCNENFSQQICIQNCIEISNVSIQLISLLQLNERQSKHSTKPFWYGYFLFTLATFHLYLCLLYTSRCV